MKTLLILLVLLSIPGAAVSAGDKIVLRAERDLYGTQLQQAAAFDGDKVTMSRNSNFLCESSNPVVLGVFESKGSEKLQGTRVLAEQLALRVRKRPPGAVGSGTPHGLRVFLGSRELTGDRAYSDAVQRLITGLCDAEAAGLVAKSAVQVELKGSGATAVLLVTELSDGAKGKTEERSLSEASCKTAGKKLTCTVANWGTATFKAPGPH
ncbi:MAG: hypothetical protein HY075_15250 [Deltaproteobacteria bacterium]|nr:hypothetical protein [Deltaproteobacteria bacterium]